MDTEKVRLHERFVANLNGTDMAEVFWLSVPFHTYTFLSLLVGIGSGGFCHCCSNNCVPYLCEVVAGRRVSLFVKEMVLIVIPILLSMTVVADISPIALPVIAATVISIVTVMCYLCNAFTVDSCAVNPKPPSRHRRRSYVTCARAMVNVVAAVSMLAVDFHIFPRRFAKTATYGYSLMDAGVGLFVIANSVVVKVEDVVQAGYMHALPGSSVLLMLGLLRCYSVRTVNYQVHVAEYGVHWNFFFTLGVVRLASSVMLKACQRPLLLGVALCILHQILLTAGLEEYVLSDIDRNGWIDANREGICSVMGYVSLYLVGVSLNPLLVGERALIADCKVMSLLSFTSFTLILATLVLGRVLPVSRRLVNVSYVAWVTSVGLLHFTAGLLVEILVRLLTRNSITSYHCLTPLVYDSISYNGLPFFLLANLFTGLVNVLFNTLDMNAVQSVLILLAYMTINCGVVFVLYLLRKQLKFW